MAQTLPNQSAYAKYRGVRTKDVTEWKALGLLSFTTDGRINVTESDKKVDARRRRVAKRSENDGEPSEIAHQIVNIEGDAPHSRSEAERIKENYLALLRQIEYDRESQQVVPISAVVQAVAEEYGKVRARLLNVAAKVSPRAAVLRTPEEVKALIDEEVNLALEELTIDRYDSGEVQKRFGDSPKQA